MADGSQKYKELFIAESEGEIAALASTLLLLEKDPGNHQLYAELMRNAHTLKGGASTMGYQKIANLAHKLEDVFRAAEDGDIALSPDRVSLVLKSVDALTASLDAIKSGSDELSIDAPLATLDRMLGLRGPHEEEEAPRQGESPKVRLVESVRVPVGELDALMGLFEEMLLLQLKLDTVLEPAIDAAKLVTDSHLRQKLFFIKEFKGLFGEFARLLVETQEKLLRIRLIPLEQIFGQFPRMIRDLSQREGKRVELRIEGAEVELDRRVLEGLGGALIHLLRNAVDHGITKEGVITLSAQRLGDRVQVVVEDNGGGIDYERLEEVARACGILDRSDPSKAELAELIFHPHMSTNKSVTSISGRGIGLFAVREFAQSVGGYVNVFSPIPETERGTRFVLDLPVSLATLRVLLVESWGFVFAIPFANVRQTLVIPKDSVSAGTVMLGNNKVSVLALDKVLRLGFGAHFEDKNEHSQNAVLLSGKQGEIVLLVDRCLDQRELLVKALPPVLQKVQGFSGSALIPDGRTILVLDIYSLISLHRRSGPHVTAN